LSLSDDLEKYKILYESRKKRIVLGKSYFFIKALCGLALVRDEGSLLMNLFQVKMLFFILPEKFQKLKKNTEFRCQSIPLQDHGMSFEDFKLNKIEKIFIQEIKKLAKSGFENEILSDLVLFSLTFDRMVPDIKKNKIIDPNALYQLVKSTKKHMYLRILNFFIFIFSTECYKILVYQTTPGNSHVQFSGKLVDVLVDAGHTVDKLIVEWNPHVTSNGTKKASRIRRFSLSKPSPWLSMPHITSPFDDKFYHMADDEPHFYRKTLAEFCDEVLGKSTILEWIKEGNYDAALSSAYDACGYGLFHLAGIKSTFTYSATPLLDHWAMILGIPNIASFVPNPLRNNKEGDRMTVFQKLSVLSDRTYQQQVVLPSYHDVQTEVFRKYYGDNFPSVTDLAKRIEVIFVNSHPLLELQRPYSHKVKQIGGITMKRKDKLFPEFEKILSSSKKGAIVFSFGSIVKISEVPNPILEIFIKVFSSLTDYSIIWKFDEERPELFNNSKNIHPVKWIQQVELLQD
ncbi:hypothetical protein FO519_009535, partial [Halicephalobus sp. NKZ332]